MLPSILRDPANCTGHFKASVLMWFIEIIRSHPLDRFSALLVISVVYDHDILSHGDVLLNAAERASDIFLRVAMPEKADVLSAFPFCKCIDYCAQAYVTFVSG
jgi:hypothetical protein